MDYLPIFLNIRGQRCLVVGGGSVAARKAALLIQAGGHITIISPNFSPKCETLIGQVEFLEKPFDPEDISGFQLVISATNQSRINREVAAAAKRRNIPVNVVDCPELCSFILPAIIDRSPVIAAVSSSGSSPVLSRIIRGKLESAIPISFGSLAKLAQKYRTQVKTTFEVPEQRRRFWERVLEGEVAEHVFSGKLKEAENLLLQLLSKKDHCPLQGQVYLVGAGPGDPDLLTLRALRLMQLADVVVYDRLVSPQILNLVRRDAEKIYAGKARSHHSIPQGEINSLLANLAISGKRVLRLKGGDPFIFGRGGEEIETLMEQGIPIQVVPGITAASGCAAYAGIPLTHRDCASSCIFVTGNKKEGTVNLNWDHLYAPNQTIVIYMGLLGLEQICISLIDYGAPPNLPAALIEQGTTSQQRVIAGTLSTLPGLVLAAKVNAPTLVIIGEVVKLHDKLAWFQHSKTPEIQAI